MGKCTFGAGLFLKKRGFYFAFCRKETKAMTNRKNAFHAIWLLIETHLFTFVQKRNLNCFLPQLISDFFSTKLDICSEKDGFHIYFKFDCLNISLWVSRVHKIHKKVFAGFDNIFHVYLMRRFQKYGRNWMLTVASWGKTKAGQKCANRWAEFAVPIYR